MCSIGLAPLLAKHRLCVLPRVRERRRRSAAAIDLQLLINVALRVSFTLVSADDGSSHKVEAYGEALDGGDKATAKAMSAAYKSAMLQTFCIPVAGAEDADRTSHRLLPKTQVPSHCRAGSNGDAISRTSSACAKASRRSTRSSSATASS